MRPDDLITSHFRLTAAQQNALKKLRLATVRDLLFHFPSRYEYFSEMKRVSDAAPNKSVTLYGKITKIAARKAFRSKKPLAEGVFEDGSGKIKVIWFNQPYMANMVAENAPVKLTGKIVGTPPKHCIANPEVERVDALPDAMESFFERKTNEEETCHPLYPESRGVTSKWFYHAVQKILGKGVAEALPDPIPPDIRTRYHLPSLRSALVWMHFPKKKRDAVSARKRFAFEEVFFIQIAKQRKRATLDAQPSFVISADERRIAAFTKCFSFTLTGAQRRVINDILNDFKTPHAMSRLLEGDVGSGKTAVAAATAYAVVETTPKGGEHGQLQVAYMAPTEILAKQHFQSFVEHFSVSENRQPVQVGLITGSGCKKFPSKVSPTQATDVSRAQLLKWVANGEIPILVGTHALIQKSVRFKNLTYVIIDEQHRFGTMQRQKLARKDNTIPHLLSMTATPIPRTLALTIYGDLDLSLLDEMPKGRKPVMTEIVAPDTRESAYAKVREELGAGRQVYVICPRIDEPDENKAFALRVKSVTEEAARLKKDIFPEYEIAILHSKMKPKEKEDIMERFTNGKIHILVATSVVEVGVNVPNATTIIIEGAERFGLAQIHQLRGRVLRSTHQARCFILTDSKSIHTMQRLRALLSAKNGFDLAERDLALRGAGELSGARQWGISDIGMEAIKNIKMVEAARAEAKRVIAEDPDLRAHKEIKKQIEEKFSHLHFE